jgi:hypothetical protein
MKIFYEHIPQLNPITKYLSIYYIIIKIIIIIIISSYLNDNKYLYNGYFTIKMSAGRCAGKV